MREKGEPTVVCRIVPSPREQVSRNREELRCVLEQICSEQDGAAFAVQIDWSLAGREEK